MDSLAKQNLRQRTRERNTSLWSVPGWSGLLQPVIDQESALNLLSRPVIENYMAVYDEGWDLKESQAVRSSELEQFGINQDRQLAEAKVALARQKLALKKSADQYALAAEEYAVIIKELLMTAQEYAARVELEMLGAEEGKAALAVEKEGLRYEEVSAKILLETFNQAQVKAEVAKYKVDVAKANVRALLADIEAGEADIKLINAQTQQYQAAADKAMLQAEVQRILAQVMVKQLSQTKLDVGRAEIQAGFAYIQSKLDDMIKMWDSKDRIVQIKIDGENALIAEILRLFEEEKAYENLLLTKELNDVLVQQFTKILTNNILSQEAILKHTHTVARELLSDARLQLAIQRDRKQTWAQALINSMHKWAYKNSVSYRTQVMRETQYITGEAP